MGLNSFRLAKRFGFRRDDEQYLQQRIDDYAAVCAGDDRRMRWLWEMAADYLAGKLEESQRDLMYLEKYGSAEDVRDKEQAVERYTQDWHFAYAVSCRLANESIKSGAKDIAEFFRQNYGKGKAAPKKR